MSACERCGKETPADVHTCTPTPYVARLEQAAWAVVNRWHTPMWKDVEPTGAVIQRLEAALRGEEGYSPFGNSINAAVNGEGEKG